jgi:choline-sulfatase
MSQPNVVIILADHFNGYAIQPDASPCQTPNLDKLAEAGLRFNRAYTTNAICSPARASMMTGQYPSKHGVFCCIHGTQQEGWVDLKNNDAHFAHRLAEAGYKTGYFGKWHVEPTETPAKFGWQEVDRCCRHSTPYDPETYLGIETPGYPPAHIAGVCSHPETPTHPAFDNGIEYIERRAQENAPFCCVISTIEPHDMFVALRDYFEKYDLESIPLPETLRDDLKNKPELLKRMAGVWDDFSDDDWRFVRACYWAVCTFLDNEVGRVMTTLKEQGIDENTIVLFTADHGDMLGAHGLLTKGSGTSYEEVYRIPFILRVPDQTVTGEDDLHKVSLVDMAPTLCELCGCPPLESAQGKSMVPVLNGSADPAEWSTAYAEFYAQRIMYTQRMYWEGDWKLTYSPAGVDELYHLADDPLEMNNLAGDSDSQDQLQSMFAGLWAKMDEVGDTAMFNTNYNTIRLAPFGPRMES